MTCEAKNLYNKKKDKDVFIHQMHIKMANMDKLETPPCLIALCKDGKCLTPIWQTIHRSVANRFNVCTRIKITTQVAQGADRFPIQRFLVAGIMILTRAYPSSPFYFKRNIFFPFLHPTPRLDLISSIIYMVITVKLQKCKCMCFQRVIAVSACFCYMLVVCRNA